MCTEVSVAMNDETRRRYSLNISRQTKDLLSSIKHTGQSYDGLIQDLVKYWKEGRQMECKSAIRLEKKHG